MIIGIVDNGTHLELTDDSDDSPREIGQTGAQRSDDFNKYTKAYAPKQGLLIIEQATYVYITTIQGKVFKLNPLSICCGNSADLTKLLNGMLKEDNEGSVVSHLDLLRSELKEVNKKLNKILC